MPCERCHGFMLVDHFLDLEDDGGHLWLRAWRCMNCGEVLEPGMGMDEHRAVHRTFLARLRKRWAKPLTARPEVIPIGV